MRDDLDDWYVKELLIVAGLVVVTSLVLTRIVLVWARRLSWVDVPNSRSSHVAVTPKGGGLAVVAVALGWMWLTSNATDPLYLAPLGLGMSIACVIGLWDDVRPLRPLPKMLGLLTAAICVVAVFAVSTVASVPFVGDVRLGPAALPLSVFWLAGYANAFNFMDGLNGMAGCTALVSASVYAVAEWRCDGGSVTSIAGVAALAVLGFLPFNFPKARIFLGDSGSLPLGLLLAWLAVQANVDRALPFPASILLLGPFLFDVTFTLFRRWREGKTIGEAHKEHLYQRLSRVWGSHAKVSLLYAGFSCVTGVLALQYASMSDLGKLLSLVLSVAAMLGFAALVLAAERAKGR